MTSAQRFVLFATIISDGQRLTDGAVAVDGDRISFSGNRDEFLARPDAADYEQEQLPEGSLLLPGLVDVHCHGADGADFPTPDHAGVRQALDYLHAAGTTTLLASLVTADPQQMLQAAEVLAEFCESGDLAGLHSEGPFLSEARCGAQDPAYLTDHDPDFVDELVAASRGQLRTMTYAPERNGSEELIEQLVSHGIVPSLGHTDADSQAVAQSLQLACEELASAGVDGFTERPTVTHLFNAMSPLHHREPGAVGASLEAAMSENAIVELVADGVHLSADTVRLVFRMLSSEDIVLVTDSMAATGLADGRYSLGPQEVDVKDGVARLVSNGTIAGGTATMLQVLQRTVAAGVPLVDALLSATTVPATLIGLADEAGRLHQGFVADVVVCDEDLELQRVYRRGLRL